MERDIVVEAAQLSRLSPRRIFLEAHGRRPSEAFYHYREWLIYDVVSDKVEHFILKLRYGRIK